MNNSNYTIGTRRTQFASAGWALLLAAALILVAGCSGGDREQPAPAGSKTETQTSADKPAAATEQPVWVKQMQTWPDTLRYTFDSTLEVWQDDLMLRLRTQAALDLSGKVVQDEKPLRCEVLMTVRPIPEWPLAQGLAIDSVVFHDPLKGRDLPALQMLAYQRDYSEQTVRTQFVANMGDAYRRSPDLTEGQDLVPTIYLSWDDRVIVASMPPVKVTFIKE